MINSSIPIIPRWKIILPFRVYIVLNLQNGFAYVGKESGFVGKRRRDHISDAKRGSQRAFACAIRE